MPWFRLSGYEMEIYRNAGLEIFRDRFRFGVPTSFGYENSAFVVMRLRGTIHTEDFCKLKKIHDTYKIAIFPKSSQYMDIVLYPRDENLQGAQ